MGTQINVSSLNHYRPQCTILFFHSPRSQAITKRLTLMLPHSLPGPQSVTMPQCVNLFIQHPMRQVPRSYWLHDVTTNGHATTPEDARSFVHWIIWIPLRESWRWCLLLVVTVSESRADATNANLSFAELSLFQIVKKAQHISGSLKYQTKSVDFDGIYVCFEITTI